MSIYLLFDVYVIKLIESNKPNTHTSVIKNKRFLIKSKQTIGLEFL